MSIWMLVLFAIAMVSAVVGQVAEAGYVWAAWLACLVASGVFTGRLLTVGVRKPVV